MKKIVAILLAVMLVVSLVACGSNPGTGRDDEGGKNNENKKNISISITSIDGYDLPEAALAYVGTLTKASNDDSTTFHIKSKNADEDAFDALIAYYADNGGTLDEEKSTSTGKYFNFSWGHLEVYHFGVDEEISVEIVLTESSDNGGEEKNEISGNQGGTPVTGSVAWPENEWTSIIPKAADTVLKIDENMETGMGKAYVLYMDWTDEDALAYGQKLVDAGKIIAVGDLISNVYYVFFTDLESGRMVMINEIGETENDYVIVLYK